MRHLLNSIIAKLARADERDALIGDLTEEYVQRVRPSRGPIRARYWYLKQAILVCVHARTRTGSNPGRSSMTAGLGRDLRQSARGLLRTPAFTAAAIVSLAMGIGASTAIFSVANPVLFQPLPYPDASRIVRLWYASGNGVPIPQTFGTYRELAARSRMFESLAAIRSWQPAISGQDAPERLDGLRVTAQYFKALGVPPALGRHFDPADDRPGGASVALIAHSLWQRRLGGDHAIVGQTILLNDSPYFVLGVMPETFEDVLSPRAEIWGLLQYDPSLPPDGREWGHHLSVIGRLASGASLVSAREELDQIARIEIGRAHV